MNEMHTEPGDQISSAGLPFFRAEDRLRLEGYVSALMQKGMSLSLVSTDEAILGHYGKILVARLRLATPDAQLEVYFPANSEALLARFNEALASSSVQNAMEEKSRLAPSRIWIVHDAGALPDHELQLLARLVQHFPGANIRVVLLLTKASQKQKLLDSFGRRILCWDIEPPTSEQAENLLAQASSDGSESAMRALLKKLALPQTRVSGVNFSAPPLPVVSSTSTPNQTTESRQVTGSGQGKAWRWLLAAMAQVSSPDLTRLLAPWKTLLAGKTPLTKAPGPVAAPESQAPAPTPTTSASVAPAASAPALPAPATLPAPADRPKKRIPKPVKESQALVELTAEHLVGQAWVQQMPSGAYLVPHIISITTYQKAMRWLQRHPEFKKARIVATYTPQEKNARFAIVSGPFNSLIEATRFVENDGIPKDPWIRAARFMKEQFTPELAAAHAKKRQESKR